jgi:branched-chain amino acid transport system ATP-binding protein
MPSLSVRELEPAGGRSRCSFDVASGEIVALEGRSAAETSLILQAIAGDRPAVSGSIRLDGRELAGLESDARAALGLGYLPQGHRVFASLRVGEHLRLAERARGPRPLAIADVEVAIPLLSERRRQLARTLSGGETQLLLLAQTLVGNAPVLLLDQPFEGLDPGAIALVRSLLEQRRNAGAAILIADARAAEVRALPPTRTVVL